MSYKGREIEVKLQVEGMYLSTLADLLRSSLQVERSVHDTSTDTYWHLGEGVRGDFIRMREEHGYIQITVKGKDKGSNLDRIELEIDTKASRSMVKNLLTAAHGRPAGTIRKTYHVFWLEGRDDHTNVSCYSIGEDLDTAVTYIEIESTNVHEVLELETLVLDLAGREGIQVGRAAGSLYELYLERKIP